MVFSSSMEKTNSIAEYIAQRRANERSQIVQDEKIDENDQEQTDGSDGSTRAGRILEGRMRKRHRRASVGKLISYLIALIGVLLLMLWLRRGM